MRVKTTRTARRENDDDDDDDFPTTVENDDDGGEEEEGEGEGEEEVGEKKTFHRSDEESSEDDRETGDTVSGLQLSSVINNSQTNEYPTFHRRQSVSAECIDRTQLLMQMKKDESIEVAKGLKGEKDAPNDKNSYETITNEEGKNEIVAASEKEQEVLLKIISESPLMSHLCIQIQKELVSSLKKERAFQKGDCIIEQGGTANCLYILEQGECEVFKKVSEEEGVKKVNVVEQGTCFGELGLLHDCPRAASVICSSDDGAVIWRLDRSIFRKLVMFAGASEGVGN